MQPEKLSSIRNYSRPLSLDIIHNVVQVLQLLKLTVEVLCRWESNLLTADVALGFKLKKPSTQKTAVGTDLANALSRRIDW